MVLILVGFVAAFGMNFQITTALVAKQVFHQGAASFGLASTMLAVGALTGALLAARRTRTSRRLMLSAAVGFGSLELATGLMPTYALFLVLLVPTGIAMMTFMTAANATMQFGIPSEMRGRVMGLYMLVFLGTNPFGAPIIGWLSEVMGPRASIVLGGLVATLTTLIVIAIMVPRQTIVGGVRSLPAAFRPRQAFRPAADEERA
jgi:MFS family permease